MRQVGWILKDYVALHSLFPGSPIRVVSLADFEEDWPVVMSGPAFQIKFLYELLLETFKKVPLSPESGGWVGLHMADPEHANILYRRGYSFEERIRLIADRLRKDLATYADMRLSEKSKIVIFRKREGVHDCHILNLPPDFKNGRIILPILDCAV